MWDLGSVIEYQLSLRSRMCGGVSALPGVWEVWRGISISSCPERVVKNEHCLWVAMWDRESEFPGVWDDMA